MKAQNAECLGIHSENGTEVFEDMFGICGRKVYRVTLLTEDAYIMSAPQ